MTSSELLAEIRRRHDDHARRLDALARELAELNDRLAKLEAMIATKTAPPAMLT
jgi:chaperonin cofactor prefoldin